MKKAFYILALLILSVDLIGQTKTTSKPKVDKKDTGYKEAVATIVSKGNSADDYPFISNIGSGHNRPYANYEFIVKRKINEYSEYEGSKSPTYDFKIVGKADVGWEIGEKFIVKYDSTKYDNDHHFLVYYKPLFLDGEKSVSTKGKISEVYGMDKIHGGIGISFQYYIPVVNEKKDTVYTVITKYQYLPPELDIGKIKKDTLREYKVLYSIENPKRAIIYYLQD